MAERSQNRRVASRVSREIEIRRDVESRAALECEFLDSIARALDGARHAWIEGISIERSSQHLPQFRDDRSLPVEDLLLGGDRVDDLLASLASLVREPDQVPLQIAGIVGE